MSDNDEQQIAAELIETGGLDAAAVYRYLDCFIPAATGTGRGFCDPFLLELIPWSSAVAVAGGVTFDPDAQLVRHESWFSEKGSPGCIGKLRQPWLQSRRVRPVYTWHHIRSMRLTYSWQVRGDSCVLDLKCAFASGFSVR